MKRDFRNIKCHELLGLHAKVVSALDPSVIGFEGKIIDESLKTFRLKDPISGRVKTIFKFGSIFSIYIPELNKSIEIDGDLLVGRPEERVRRC